MSLASTLKSMRTDKRVSLQTVADAVDATKPYIWELERGTAKNPSLELLTKLADYYGVTVDYLSGRDSDVQSAKIKAFARELEGLSDNDIELLRNTARRLNGDPK